MNGGRIQLEFSHGLDQILARPWIRNHLEELWSDPSETPRLDG